MPLIALPRNFSACGQQRRRFPLHIFQTVSCFADHKPQGNRLAALAFNTLRQSNTDHFRFAVLKNDVVITLNQVIAAACQHSTLANAVCIELFFQRFANPIINFQAKASVILTTLALLMPGTQGQKRHWRVIHFSGNRMWIFLAFIFTKQPDFIAIILFIHQACAKLRPGR